MKKIFHDDFSCEIEDRDLIQLCSVLMRSIDSGTDPSSLIDEFIVQSKSIIKIKLAIKVADRVKGEYIWPGLDELKYIIELLKAYTVVLNTYFTNKNHRDSASNGENLEHPINDVKFAQEFNAADALEGISNEIKNSWFEYGFDDSPDEIDENNKKLNETIVYILDVASQIESTDDILKSNENRFLFGRWEVGQEMQYVVYDQKYSPTDSSDIGIFFLGGELKELDASIVRKSFLPIYDKNKHNEICKIYRIDLWKKFGVSWSRTVEEDEETLFVDKSNFSEDEIDEYLLISDEISEDQDDWARSEEDGWFYGD